MESGLFSTVSASEEDLCLIKREDDLYARPNDIRSAFGRDYTRILHCLAYRRLKHKTQVFFNTSNDHICTRIEHVNHVDSVSYTIAKYLGLNTELTRAISIGHDIGHAPFGHQGEKVLEEIFEKYLHKGFWHEQNGLRFVDEIELLEDDARNYRNLNLTYAVRDGIISHCGEIDQNNIKPRKEYISLNNFNYKGQYEPYTWEGCIVKIADKIAYLGRDIEDAIRLKFLSLAQLRELGRISRKHKNKALNTTIIMHKLITDLCSNSNPRKGLCFSKGNLEMINEIKRFNYDTIYNSEKLNDYKNYSKLVLSSIFHVLLKAYDKDNIFRTLYLQKKYLPELITGFIKWLVQYCDINESWASQIQKRCRNKKIYNYLETEELYIQSIIDYISGMTDQYAVTCFEEIIKC